MRNVRALLTAVAPGSLVTALVITALLLLMGLGNVTAEAENARCRADDWAQAIEHIENGATDYQGRCMGISTGGPVPEDLLEDFRAEADLARREFEEAAGALAAGQWKRAADATASFPLVFFALFMGGVITGSPMGSAVAAWSLSNGWTRRAWIRNSLVLAVLATLALYLLATVAGVVIIQSFLGGAGIEAGFPMPGIEALRPLPGLLYFTMLGALAGLVLGRGELAGMVAVAVTLGDFALSARYPEFPLLPTRWHQTALGLDTGAIGPGLAVALAGTMALLLASLGRWYFLARRDVPDR
jgi:hypothetical protein